MTSWSKRFRLAVAVLLSVLWTAWGIWSNSPHHYDAQAMEQELAELFPLAPVPTLEPATGGFPVVHMRYDFSRNDQLTIHEYSKDKLGLNLLLCALATIAVAILATRTTNAPRATLVVTACLLLPACVASGLFGLHPLVVAYAYFLPLIVLIGSVFTGSFRSDEDQNLAANQSCGVGSS